jgi:hypothetical protein
LGERVYHGRIPCFFGGVLGVAWSVTLFTSSSFESRLMRSGKERKEIKRLVAKTHPDNIASQKVCVKCGGKKGEVLKDDYERYVDAGVKSDVWLFYFDRPSEGGWKLAEEEEGGRGL